MQNTTDSILNRKVYSDGPPVCHFGHPFCHLFAFDADNYGIQMTNQTYVGCFDCFQAIFTRKLDR